MAQSKSIREREIFEVFAKVAKLGPGTVESRPEPEPDILFLPITGEAQSFELVEILDNALSAATARTLDTKDACLDYLSTLPSLEQARFTAKYSNADICLAFNPDVAMPRRKALLPKIFQSLLSAPDDFEGDLPNTGSSLARYINYISIHRASFIGPMFDTPCTTWMGDPTVAAIDSKMAKTYSTTASLNLLAYIDSNPMRPEEVWNANLDEYLETLDESTQFKRIVVFHLRKATICREWRRGA